MSRAVTATIVQFNDTTQVAIKWRLHDKREDRAVPPWPMRLTMPVEAAEELHAALGRALSDHRAMRRAKGRHRDAGP